MSRAADTGPQSGWLDSKSGILLADRLLLLALLLWLRFEPMVNKGLAILL